MQPNVSSVSLFGDVLRVVFQVNTLVNNRGLMKPCTLEQKVSFPFFNVSGQSRQTFSLRTKLLKCSANTLYPSSIISKHRRQRIALRMSKQTGLCSSKQGFTYAHCEIPNNTCPVFKYADKWIEQSHSSYQCSVQEFEFHFSRDLITNIKSVGK